MKIEMSSGFYPSWLQASCGIMYEILLVNSDVYTSVGGVGRLKGRAESCVPQVDAEQQKAEPHELHKW